MEEIDVLPANSRFLDYLRGGVSWVLICTKKGVPTVDQSTCTGCGLCIKACPDGVLALENGKPKAGEGVFMGCIACGHCVAACPTGSVTVTGRGMTRDDAFVLPPAFQRATADQLDGPWAKTLAATYCRITACEVTFLMPCGENHPERNTRLSH
jgi:NAD-dependent dihydropyrimidine dehydrogenase PreA subunit